MSGKSWLRIVGEDGSTMTWPNPTDPTELQRRLRSSPDSLTRGDQLAIASVLHAYAYLIGLDAKTRQRRVMQIRAAVAAEGVPTHE